jgi:hypothetical protein
MKELICNVKKCLQKYTPEEVYLNCYLKGMVAGRSYSTKEEAVEQRESCDNSGITLKITRTREGNFEVYKVEEF